MIGLIDYGMGNLLSVSKAFESIGADVLISEDPSALSQADAVVLPGVGNFGDGMKHLSERGLDKFVIDSIDSGKPFMGICLGMQLLMESSEEAPGISGLAVFKGSVPRFPDMDLKIPHMGWNDVTVTENGSARFANVPDNSYFYFVHSYYVAPEDSSIVAGTCSYGIDFAASISRDNIFATQFHPEKSQDCGIQLLKNFCEN
jgi:glutamine amidotransferase